MMDVINRKEPTQRPSSPTQGESERLPGVLEVNVTTAEEVVKALEEAIAVITKTATHHLVGVLVTRTGTYSYIVRAHPAVPYGLIRQQHGEEQAPW